MFGAEQELVAEAFASNYIAPCGPMVERFERALAENVGVPYACALASGTAGLDLLYHELKLKPGDTIFCSNLTFVASIAPAVHRGATPVFIGSDVASWTLSPSLLEEALEDARRAGRLPRAVVAVDLYGQCCDYEAIEGLCQRFEVPLIVDAAEALGAKYIGANGVARSAGDAGWAALYSFNGNKIITSSGGGMVVSRDEGLIARTCKRSQQSREKNVWYEHCELGFNYRMSNVVAAIGLGQLMNLDQILARKRRNFEVYREHLSDLSGVEFMPEAPYSYCNRWLTVIRLNAPGAATGAASDQPSQLVLKVIAALEAANIEARPVWKPMHMQPVFAGSRVYGARFDEELFEGGICLPSGTGLSEAEIERVAGVMRPLL